MTLSVSLTDYTQATLQHFGYQYKGLEKLIGIVELYNLMDSKVRNISTSEQTTIFKDSFHMIIISLLFFLNFYTFC